MLRETDEQYHQIELEEYFDDTVKPDLFAVSRIFAEARKQMTLSEYKTLTLALTSVKWKDACPEILYLDKKEVAKVVGINSDADHLSENLYRSIGDMPHHSYLRFSDKDKDLYVNGNFVRTIAFFKNKVRIKLEPDFLGLFGNLDKNYITMWSGDIFKLKSERAVKFYEVLRGNSDTRQATQTGTVGIKFLKELYDIPKDGKGSYVYKGHFKRSEFETYVIDPICEDLARTDMIKLIVQPDGKFYEKVKRGNRVIAYRFFWTISSHPRVASAAEVKEIQEKVDADAQVLKVAKDIVKGQKEQKKKTKSGAKFNDNFHQRDYDYEALERQLLAAQDAPEDTEG